MVVASFGASSMCLFEPVTMLWPRACHLLCRAVTICLGRSRGRRSRSSSSSSRGWCCFSSQPRPTLLPLVGGDDDEDDQGSAAAGGGDSGGIGDGGGGVGAVGWAAAASAGVPLPLSRSGATQLSSLLAASLVACWLLTGHWLALDVLGVCITISVVSLVRLPSLKVAAIALVSLFFYDIFWCVSCVFVSSRVVLMCVTFFSNGRGAWVAVLV